MNREQLANSAINKIRRNRFDWADWNCAIASARVAKTYCGIDYSERYFSECKGMLSALRIVKNAGGLDNLIIRTEGNHCRGFSNRRFRIGRNQSEEQIDSASAKPRYRLWRRDGNFSFDVRLLLPRFDQLRKNLGGQKL